MKIGMILDNEIPTDERVEKEAISLIEAGHEVFILSFTYGILPKYEEYQGIKINRVFMPKYLKKKLSALILTFPFYNLFWKNKINKFIKENKIEILHIHDLPLCGIGIEIAKKNNIPIIADMHENYPILISEEKYANTFLGKLLINKKKWFIKEKEWLNEVDGIVCVAEEMKNRLSEILDNKKKFAVVPNTIHVKNYLGKQKRIKQIEDKFRNTFSIFYFGGFDSVRGIELLIEAGNILKDKIPNLKIILVGTGYLEKDLKKLVENYKMEEIVSFEGWRDSSVLLSYMENIDVCVIPHLKSPQTDNSSPNKLFIYMIFKKPVISSNCDSLQKIIEENNCGLIFKDKDFNDLADKIYYLYKNPDKKKELGENAYNLVINKYNWENTVKEMIDLYASFERKN